MRKAVHSTQKKLQMGRARLRRAALDCADILYYASMGVRAIGHALIIRLRGGK